MIFLSNRFLLDASSFVYALKLKRVDIIQGNYIQQLTVYEAINAIWKEAHLFGSLSAKEAQELVEIVAKIFEYLKVLSIHPYELDVLKRAMKLGLTVYDASYLVLAEKNDLTLLTEDKELKEKAGRRIKVISVKDLVK